MKTKLFLSAILAIFIFSFYACTKEEKFQLPPETRTGENTFGCKIDGVIYKAEGSLLKVGFAGFDFQSEGVRFSGDEYISIDARVRNRDRETKNIHIRFPFNGKLGVQKADIVYQNTPAMESSYINITRFDNGILSGTFMVKTDFKDEDGNPDIVELTEGRFDINTKTE